MRVQRGQHPVDGGFHRFRLVDFGHIFLAGPGQDFSKEFQLLVGHRARIGLRGRGFLRGRDGGQSNCRRAEDQTNSGANQQ